MNKKLIIFGPWCGEFCYELSWWIPEIRKKRNTDFKDWDAIAVGFDGRKVLYEDFTQAYIPYPKDIDDTLMYPATYGEHIGQKDIIPDNLKDEDREIVLKEYEKFSSKVDVPIRKMGSASLDMSYVAAGRFDGFWQRSLNYWDIAAGVIIVKEAGGFVTDFAGSNKYVDSDKLIDFHYCFNGF